MTVAELYSEVAHLGFEASLEDACGFYAAVRRATLQVAALRPTVRHLVIEHFPPENLLPKSAEEAQALGSPAVFEAEGARAFSLEAAGRGSLRVEHREEGTWLTVGILDIECKAPKVFRAFIKNGGEFLTGRVRLHLLPDGAVFVKNVAMYAFVYGNELDDIPPLSPYVSYDMKLLCEDFLAFAAPPVSLKAGEAPLSDGYLFEGASILALSRERHGSYRVAYRSKPSELAITEAPEKDEAEIELDEELAALLPLLVAAYVWADYEPEKAQYYLALYRERAAYIVAADRDLAPATYRNVYGW